eukprot:7178166-Alexandrium_andersonii.AAC.1
MSASLVGSEMCIRDRGAGGRPRLRGRGRTWQPWLAGERRAARRSCRAGPVSYTHLTLPTICSV